MKKLFVIALLAGCVVLYFNKIRKPILILDAGDRVYSIKTPRSQIWSSKFNQTQSSGLVTMNLIGRSVETLPGTGKVTGSAIIYSKLPQILLDRADPNELISKFSEGLGELKVTSRQPILGGGLVGTELGFHGKIPFGFGLNDFWGRMRILIVEGDLVMVFVVTQKEGGDQDPRLIRYIDTFAIEHGAASDG